MGLACRTGNPVAGDDDRLNGRLGCRQGFAGFRLSDLGRPCLMSAAVHEAPATPLHLTGPRMTAIRTAIPPVLSASLILLEKQDDEEKKDQDEANENLQHLLSAPCSYGVRGSFCRPLPRERHIHLLFSDDFRENLASRAVDGDKRPGFMMKPKARRIRKGMGYNEGTVGLLLVTGQALLVTDKTIVVF